MLLERAIELAALEDAWARARAGHGGLVVVTGEAGAGKTSLVQAFVPTVGVDAPVLWGACDPLSSPRPLGPFHDVAPELSPEVRTALATGPGHEVAAAIVDHLRAAPAVLVVDDLHWADQGTIDVLRFLLRRIASAPCLVVATARDDGGGRDHPMRGLLGDVARSTDARVLALEPLSVDAVRTMVATRPLDAEGLRRRTGGNPFFVTQLLEHAGEDLPRTVRDAVLARAAGLDGAARDVLELLACAPEALPDQLLRHLAIGLPALRALDAAGLLRRDRRGVGLRHDLYREAIAGNLPPGVAQVAHRRVLDALEDWGQADAAVLAHHAVAAGDPARILRHARDAGRAAARSGAHTQAAASFRSALEQRALLTEAEEAELLELLAAELYLIDELPGAIAASQRALALRVALGDTGGAGAIHAALSVYEWYNANRPTAERHVADAVALLTDGDDAARLGHALGLEAYLALQTNDLDQAREVTAHAKEAAAQARDPSLDVRVGLLDGIGALLGGDRAGRDTLLAVLAAVGDELDEITSSGYSNLVYLDVEQRRLPDATEVLGTSLPLAIERDLPVCQVWQLGTRGRLQLIAGDWPAAVDDADAVLARPCAPLARTWPHLVRGLAAVRRSGDDGGDLDVAWALAVRYREPLRLLPAATALVERAWITGRADERLAEARELLRDATTPGLDWARGDLAVWLQRLDGETPPSIGPVAPPHDHQLAGDHAAAAAAWAAIGAPYEEALALVDGATPEGTRRGLDLLDRLGADVVAAKLRQELRQRGLAAVPTRRRASTRGNAAGLTARELDVLRLLQQGLTNAEVGRALFISAKTADHHVSAILAKLGAGSRREAVVVAGRLGLLV